MSVYIKHVLSTLLGSALLLPCLADANPVIKVTKIESKGEGCRENTFTFYHYKRNSSFAITYSDLTNDKDSVKLECSVTISYTVPAGYKSFTYGSVIEGFADTSAGPEAVLRKRFSTANGKKSPMEEFYVAKGPEGDWAVTTDRYKVNLGNGCKPSEHKMTLYSNIEALGKDTIIHMDIERGYLTDFEKANCY